MTLLMRLLISRAVVNHDGRDGTAPDPLVWSAGALSKRRRLVHAVRDQAFLPGHPGNLALGMVFRFQLLLSVLKMLLFGLIPLVLLVKWVSFLNILHWPVLDLDLGVEGVSYVELLSFFMNFGLVRQFQCRLFLLVCGGLALALLVLIICRLRHIGWEKCSHGLTSRPRESASELFLDELLSLFRYLPKSGRTLLTGTLPVRYCVARFACRTPTWRLPASGHVGRLVAAHSDAAGDRGDEVIGLRVPRVSGSGPVRKRLRLNRKTPAHLVG